MKKLLLMALLCVGATSFAGVQGNTKSASMEVSVTGQVLAGNTKNLVIESETASLNGGVMAFKFGTIEKPTSGSNTVELSGTFKVRLDDNTAFAPNGVASAGNETGKLSIGFDETSYAKTKNVSDAGNGVALDYTLSGALNPGKTAYDGKIIVQATTTDSSTAGAFADIQRIYALIGE